MTNPLLDIIRRLTEIDERVTRLEARENSAHKRMDNLFGPLSLYGNQWYNRYAKPSSVDSHDAEMLSDPVGSGGWAWVTAPSSINAASGVNYSLFSDWQYVYIYGSGSGRAVLRCTDPGNFPRFKRLLINAYPSQAGEGGWQFEFRSCVDANNYICWVLDAVSGFRLSAWYYVDGVGTQVGSTIPLYPPLPLVLDLGNHPQGDYLSWIFAYPWGAHLVPLPAVSSVPGQRAENISYVELLYSQGNVGNMFSTYFIDFVRFASSVY